jgi:hypothetical protein
MQTLQKNDSGFESNWRRQQELRLRPIADRLYKSVFGDVSIMRKEREDNYLLDKYFAIDFNIALNNGMILNGQEKFLSASCARFHSVTVEYLQDHRTGERGDWFKIASQIYFVGYVDKEETRFEPWVLLNWPQMVISSNLGFINWIDNKNKDGHARASFKYCDMFEIPKNCIIDCSF